MQSKGNTIYGNIQLYSEYIRNNFTFILRKVIIKNLNSLIILCFIIKYSLINFNFEIRTLKMHNNCRKILIIIGEMSICLYKLI